MTAAQGALVTNRPVTLFIATSLDLFIARRSGAVDFLFTDGDYGYTPFYETVDVVVMGRKTYENCATFEPWPYEGKRCVVFSQTLDLTGDPRTQVVRQDPAQWLAGERQKPGKGIFLVGGGALVHDFLISGGVDRLVLSLHPVLLGEGLPLFFSREMETPLKLIETKSFPSGLVQISYERIQ